ncbi:hypothetical protein ASD07_13230 [Duganella sp. Root336D2]|nr:hypothetical protein ASD07_13230 [Duganella sp. Root336D2]
MTVTRVAGKWFVSVLTQREVDIVPIATTSAVGTDVGIVRFATLSDGTPIEPANCFKRHRQRLARYQNQISRKVKFSKNWRKGKARVQRLHPRIANMRRDFLHKASKVISTEHAIVCVENPKTWLEP